MSADRSVGVQRTLKTRVGELELMVPKDRDGEFQTGLFERCQCSEKALVLAMLQMCQKFLSVELIKMSELLLEFRSFVCRVRVARDVVWAYCWSVRLLILPCTNTD